MEATALAALVTQTYYADRDAGVCRSAWSEEPIAAAEPERYRFAKSRAVVAAALSALAVRLAPPALPLHTHDRSHSVTS